MAMRLCCVSVVGRLHEQQYQVAFNVLWRAVFPCAVFWVLFWPFWAVFGPFGPQIRPQDAQKPIFASVQHGFGVRFCLRR